MTLGTYDTQRGVRYLTRDNLKVVWAEFSTLSQIVLLYCAVSAWHDMQPPLDLKTRPRFARCLYTECRFTVCRYSGCQHNDINHNDIQHNNNTHGMTS
jgi:hypothetical protein